MALSVACDNRFYKKSMIAVPLLRVPRFEAESLSHVFFGRAAVKAAL
jgi:hypothetical protein